ncbi:hypothetical protein KSB_92150 [Ktedonobacter robiniae]|uniref:Uncharacterized protein n=1 Tax=Ktedonobacter robiniae TaxID=2778365 RepID=A0ABQ3V7Y2_9CHLR|nr:hypothetical protein KSB_92150 [Ktedonobacter robiniae]
MLRQPGVHLQAIMTAQIIGNEKNVASGVVRFDHFEQFDVIGGVARGGTPRELFRLIDSLSLPCYISTNITW